MSQRTALVVGGTSGIGLASARLLHRRGTTVHIAGRSKSRLDEVAATDPELIGHRADAANADEIGALVESIGTIDWLVLTLSGSDGIGPIADLDLEVLRGAFDAKFWAHLTTVKAALPHLAEDGSITLLGAITARAGLPGTSGVAAINGAVESLVKPLATELAPIRVNAVSPGVVDTPWWNGMSEEAKQAYFAQVAAVLPARRVGTAEDIAEVVVLAATNANTTGTVIESDGGARLVSLG
ncbi:SDR family oxidoreductase [Streptomyces sp. NPDC048473]|uniref:SDR family oxidoreductase n=1 Tax=unclassified Streptomyces TaxID=2593676 RepID=UPI0037119109